MELAIMILGALGAVLPFVVMVMKRKMERRDHVYTAIGKRDRDELRDGMARVDRVSGPEPIYKGSTPSL